jgi:hypothetical protein
MVKHAEESRTAPACVVSALSVHLLMSGNVETFHSWLTRKSSYQRFGMARGGRTPMSM